MSMTLARRLSTVHATSAVGIRAELLEACREATGASIGVFIRPTPDAAGIVRYQDLTVTGDPNASRLFSRFEGAPMQGGTVVDTSADVMSARRGAWSLQRPLRRHTNRFSPLAADMSMERMSQMESYREIYHPLDIVDHARMLVIDGQRVLAWFGVMSYAQRGLISPESVSELNHASKQVLAAIRCADALDRWDGGAAFATFQATGQLEAATPNLAGWWTSEERALIASRVRAFDRGDDAAARVAMRGASMQLLRMDGDQLRYLVTVAEAAIVVSALATLSPRRRLIAELAGLGMTTDEIAREMELSPNTVKTQLRHVYDELSVSNRAELARLVSGGEAAP